MPGQPSDTTTQQTGTSATKSSAAGTEVKPSAASEQSQQSPSTWTLGDLSTRQVMTVEGSVVPSSGHAGMYGQSISMPSQAGFSGDGPHEYVKTAEGK
ncbi:hypothetical protein IAT40_007992 [Kwoniella sp. CBS 6097]